MQYRSGKGICSENIRLDGLVCEKGYNFDEAGRCSLVANETKGFCELADGILDVPGDIFSADTTLNVTLKKGSSTEDEAEFEKYLSTAEVRLVPAIDTNVTMNHINTQVPLTKTKTGSYSVQIAQIASGSSVCQLRNEIKVVCPSNKVEVQGTCQSIDLCGNLTFDQRPALDGSSQASDLRVSVSGGQGAKDIKLVRTDAITEWGSKNLDKYVRMKTGSWQLQYSSAGQQCLTGHLSRVTCNTPAYEDKDGNCVKVANETSCGKMEVDQSASTGMSESELHVTVTGDTGFADPTIIVTRADASLELNSSKAAGGLWTKSLPTGHWLVEYRSGQSVCVSSKKLHQVKCKKGFQENEGGCVEITVESGSCL